MTSLKNTGKALDKRAHGEHIKDECDRPKLWQMYGKMVGSELTALSAPKVLGKLRDMTYGAFNILMGHRSETVGFKLSKVEDARLDRWTSVGYDAVQVVGCGGAKRVPSRSCFLAKKCGLMPKDDFMWFLMRRRKSVRSRRSRTRCFCASCGAPGERGAGTCTVTMQCGDEEESCMVYQDEYPPHENCQSVIEA